MFKNAARYLIGVGRLACGAAPSYFVESLLFNAPNGIFADDSDETLYNVLMWLDGCPDWSALVCQHCESHLFGPSA